ncbi:unnamed protein product [Boreogadus saida]
MNNHIRPLYPTDNKPSHQAYRLAALLQLVCSIDEPTNSPVGNHVTDDLSPPARCRKDDSPIPARTPLLVLAEDPLINQSLCVSIRHINDPIRKRKPAFLEPIQPKQIPVQKGSGCELAKWTIKYNREGLYVDGIRTSDNTPWHSTIIVKRISGDVLRTLSGKTYSLIGPMNMHESSKFPNWLLRKFVHGFPPDWKKHFNCFLLDFTPAEPSESDLCSIDEPTNSPVGNHVTDDLSPPARCRKDDSPIPARTPLLVLAEDPLINQSLCVSIRHINDPIRKRKPAFLEPIQPKQIPVQKGSGCELAKWTIKYNREGLYVDGIRTLGLGAGSTMWDWVLGLQCGTGCWVYSVGLGAGSTVWDWVLGLQCGTGCWVYSVGLGAGSTVWGWVLGLQCGTGFWVYSVGLGAGSTVWDWVLGLQCGTGSTVWGWVYSVGLGAGTTVWGWVLGLQCGTGFWVYSVGLGAGTTVWGWVLGLQCGAGCWDYSVGLGLQCGAGSTVWGWVLGLQCGAGSTVWGWVLGLQCGAGCWDYSVGLGAGTTMDRSDPCSPPRSDNTPWHSTIIVKRISGDVLRTLSGKTYSLIGPMNMHESSKFPNWLLRKFVHGFPPDWKKHFDCFLLEKDAASSSADIFPQGPGATKNAEKQSSTPFVTLGDPEEEEEEGRGQGAGSSSSPEEQEPRARRGTEQRHLVLQAGQLAHRPDPRQRSDNDAPEGRIALPREQKIPVSKKPTLAHGSPASTSDEDIPVRRKGRKKAGCRGMYQSVLSDSPSSTSLSSMEGSWTLQRKDMGKTVTRTDNGKGRAGSPELAPDPLSSPAQPSKRRGRPTVPKAVSAPDQPSKRRGRPTVPKAVFSPDQPSKRRGRPTVPKAVFSPDQPSKRRGRPTVPKAVFSPAQPSKRGDSGTVPKAVSAPAQPSKRGDSGTAPKRGNLQEEKVDWTEAELKSLKMAIASFPKHMGRYWVNVAMMVGTRSPEDCQTQHNFQESVKASSKNARVSGKKMDPPADQAPPAITARVGTLMRKQQVRQFMEAMPKEDNDDVFNSTAMQGNVSSSSGAVRMPSMSPGGMEQGFVLSDLEPTTPRGSSYCTVKTPSGLHISPGMIRSVNRKKDDNYIYQLQKRIKRSQVNAYKLSPPTKTFPLKPSVKRDDTSFEIWETFPDNRGAQDDDSLFEIVDQTALWPLAIKFCR